MDTIADRDVRHANLQRRNHRPADAADYTLVAHERLQHPAGTNRDKPCDKAMAKSKKASVWRLSVPMIAARKQKERKDNDVLMKFVHLEIRIASSPYWPPLPMPQQAPLLCPLAVAGVAVA